MTLLVDTHALLWFLLNHSELSGRARALMVDPEHRLLFSVAALWEIAIKVSIGKLHLAEPFALFFPRQLLLNDIDLLPITAHHTATVVQLPHHHRDPFDRMIIAQSIVEDIPVLSADAAFDAYGIRRMW